MIEIKDDEDTEMMLILKDGEEIFEGNYWDFSATPEGLKEFLEQIGLKVKLKSYKYKY